MSDTPVSELPTDVCRTHRPAARGLGWTAVHWILTGMVIAASAATVAFTGYLLRRLFTLQPGTPDTTVDIAADIIAQPDAPRETS